MENSQLARDIVADLDRKSYDVDAVASHVTDETLTTFVQTILDKVETVGGFDLSTYEADDDDDEQDLDDDDNDDFVDDDDDEPYDDDDDEELESDSTPRYDGGFWTDPNDPTA